MDYKEKYNGALEKAKKNYDVAQDLYNGSQIGVECFKNTLTNIFPELKESEDERIRKELIENFKWFCGDYPETTKWGKDDNLLVKDIIAWLEKQGESNTFEVPETSIKDAKEVTSRMQHIEGDMRPIAEFIINYANWDLHKDEWNQPTLTVPLFRVLDALVQRGKPYGECVQNIEKQGENKHVDKVEPKFKVGDFIVNDYCKGKIIELTNDAYLLDTGQGIPFSCEHNAHLWTINDAKDGDVLVTDFGENDSIVMYKSRCTIDTINIHCCLDNEFTRSNLGSYNVEDVKPATKNECDLLFQVMKEAGYRWNKEKLKLEKIESKKLDINKVIEWLRVELGKEEERHYIHVHGFDKERREIFLEDFRKAMKGE